MNSSLPPIAHHRFSRAAATRDAFRGRCGRNRSNYIVEVESKPHLLNSSILAESFFGAWSVHARCSVTFSCLVSSLICATGEQTCGQTYSLAFDSHLNSRPFMRPKQRARESDSLPTFRRDVILSPH